MELKVSEPKLDTSFEKVDKMKINLEELVQLTKTLHSNWPMVHVSTAVSLPHVSASFTALPVLLLTVLARLTGLAWPWVVLLSAPPTPPPTQHLAMVSHC